MIFEKISPFDLTYNFFSGLHKDWALLSAGDSNDIKKCNMMTVSWGNIGILWHKPVAICYIRPQRYTLEFVEKNKHFSLSFFDTDTYKDALNFCGTKSGRDFDKFIETGLTLYKTPQNNVAISQAKLILDCKVLYSDFLKEEHFQVQEIIDTCYPKKDFHKFFIGEIIDVMQASNI